MNRFRFSLASLLGFVTVAAVAFLALRNASELWGQVMFTSALAVLLFAVLAAVYRTTHAREFWVGFLLFGWTYMLLVYGPWLDRHVGRRLVTTTALRWGHEVLTRWKPIRGLLISGELQDDGTVTPWWELPHGQQGGVLVGPSLADVQAVGHPLFALLFALVGGVAGRWVHGGREAMTTLAKPGRRWFQFSLRTLLLVMTLAARWLTMRVGRAHSAGAHALYRRLGFRRLRGSEHATHCLRT